MLILAAGAAPEDLHLASIKEQRRLTHVRLDREPEFTQFAISRVPEFLDTAGAGLVRIHTIEHLVYVPPFFFLQRGSYQQQPSRPCSTSKGHSIELS
jgi:hypothetical protein